MAEELVTAAVFGDPTQAQAARLHLDEAGIPAFLADETIAGSIFVLSTAVGGIKLQVPESHLEEALRSLDERAPGTDRAVDWSDVDVGQPEMEAGDDESSPGEPPVPASSVNASVEPVDSEVQTLREKRADRLLAATILGFFCVPVLLLAFWRLVQVFVSDERLNPPQRRKAQLAGVFLIPLTVLSLTGYRLLLRGWF